MTHHARWPADAGTHEKRNAIGLQFHDLRHVRLQRLSDEPTRFAQYFVEVVGAKRKFAEFGQNRLLVEENGFAVRCAHGKIPCLLW
jgi:hypothetical protein